MTDAARPARALILRNADAEDAPAVAALRADAYAEHAAAFPADLWAAYRRELAAVADRTGDAELVLAEVDGTLRGAVTLYPGRVSDPDWPPGVASLRLLAVHPTVRGAGVGRALVEECIARSRARGCTAIGLHTAGFMRAAVRLYEGMGFTRVPDRDFDARARYGGAPGGEPVCGVAYVLSLA